MSSIRLQNVGNKKISINDEYFYISTMNILKMTVRKQFQLLQHKNNKIVKLTTKRATCILKSSLQDLKERLNNQKDSLCPWRVQDLILFTLQTVTLPNLNYRHTTISIKIPAASPLVLFFFFFW